MKWTNNEVVYSWKIFIWEQLFSSSGCIISKQQSPGTPETVNIFACFRNRRNTLTSCLTIGAVICD